MMFVSLQAWLTIKFTSLADLPGGVSQIRKLDPDPFRGFYSIVDTLTWTKQSCESKPISSFVIDDIWIRF